MAAEDDPEEVVDLALLELGGGEEVHDRVDLGQGAGAGILDLRLHPEPFDPRHVEQLVVDGEAGLGGEVVDAVDAGEEAELVTGRVLEVGEHLAHPLGVDEQRRLPVLVRGAGHGAVVARVDLLREQLQSGGVDHRQTFASSPMTSSGEPGPGGSRSASSGW